MPLPCSLAARRCAFFLLVLAFANHGAASLPARAEAMSTPSAKVNLPGGWWRDAVFYEIFVRSFADASSGPLAGDGIGDFQGLIEHLDYLNDGRGAAGTSLGVTAVWLMPIQPSPSYHGYDVSDYFGVNREFGDVELCKRFVREAHQRGIRVIIDLVLNHASSEHPLFRTALNAPAGAAKMEARKMFRFAELPENIVGPWDQRAWHRAGDAFYYGVFSPQMPDWNFHEPSVTEHHRRVAAFWLNEIGVDGFRLDAVRYFVETGEELQDTEETRQWLRGFTAYCHEVKPGSFVVGEDTARSREIARVIRGGSLDSAFEFDLSRAIYESIREETPGILMQALWRLDSMYAGDAPWSTFLTNHDQERVRTQLGDREDLARFAAKLAFTLPGVAFFYYGDELGLRGAKPDPDLRTPMPWTGEAPNAGFTSATAKVKPWHPLNGDFATVNVATEARSADSMLALYRRLVSLNASSPAIRKGTPVEISASDRRIFATLRVTADEAVLVVANFGEETLRTYTLTASKSPLRATWAAKEELESASLRLPALADDGGFTAWQPIAELPAKAVYVVRWTRG